MGTWVSLDEIIRTAGWASADTFARYYKQIHKKATYATKLVAANGLH